MAQRDKKDVLKKGTFGLAALAVVLAGASYVQTVARIDPFASRNQAAKSFDPTLGVRLENVDLKSFEGNKLASKAHIDRVDVRQDRQFFQMFGIRDGMYYGKQGQLGFESQSAEWNVAAHKLQVTSGAHLKNKDLDLQVPMFAYDGNKSVANIPGRITGRLLTGNINAMSVQYNVDNGDFKTGPLQWEGKVALRIQDEDAKPTKWRIDNKGGTKKVGDIMVHTDATADDGEIIVQADKVEHNQKTDILTASGNVRYFSAKANMVCEKAVIERGARKATLTGNVQMLVKAKEKQTKIDRTDGIPPFRPVVPDEIAKNRPVAPETGQTPEQKKLDDEIRNSKNMRDYPTICYADKIEYWYKKGSRHAILTGSPQARQELAGGWRHVWTKTAYYDGEAETLKMESSGKESKDWDTRMMDSIGDDLTSQWITLSTKEGNDDWESGPSQGTFVDTSNEVPKTGSSTTPPPVKTSTGGGGGGGATSTAVKKAMTTVKKAAGAKKLSTPKGPIGGGAIDSPWGKIRIVKESPKKKTKG